MSTIKALRVIAGLQGGQLAHEEVHGGVQMLFCHHQILETLNSLQESTHLQSALSHPVEPQTD